MSDTFSDRNQFVRFQGTLNESGVDTAQAFAPTGLTGATAASRYVGATASGAPLSGTFAVGDFIIDRTGNVYVCTTAGSPGTWTQVGGGGATPGAAIVRGPFSFAFDTAGLNNGVAFYTPTVGDFLLDVLIALDTNFDGTTPLLDIGNPTDGAGLWSFFAASGPLDLSAMQPTTPDNLMTGAESLQAGGLIGVQTIPGTLGLPVSINAKWSTFMFTAAAPLNLWVSQNGQPGGAAVGGAAGAGRVYIVTATPVAFS